MKRNFFRLSLILTLAIPIGAFVLHGRVAAQGSQPEGLQVTLGPGFTYKGN